ncbi:MAG: PKD domain-containing protein [Bacteroidota bacterium]
MRLAILLLLISFNAISQIDQNLRFIQNKGQWNDDIDFQAQVPGGRLGVSAKGFSVLLLDMEEMEHQHMAGHGKINEFDGQPSTEPIDGHYFQINLIGSNPHAKAIAEGRLDGHYNYFLGNDSCRWATNALAYASIVYRNVYDGIDFRVSSVGNNLKYDFIVSAGADPSRIKIEYCGVGDLEIFNDELKIQTTVGTLTELKPFSYQDLGNNKQTVPSEYLVSNNVVSFSFPANYDECRELIIDPLLIFSTYSGSLADNWGSTATPGEHGTLYSAGVTRQNLGGFFPATVGAFQTNNKGSFDMAIIKYDSAGTKFLYATHLGGANNDSPESLVVDKATGDLIVLGISSSPDYPTSANAFDKTFNLGTTIFNRVLNTNDQWDIVLTRLSPGGDQLVGSTFLGGSGNDGLNLPKQSGGSLVVNYGDEMRGDVITDETGHIYVSSVTSSNDFPIVNGFDNAFNGGNTDGLLAKLAPDLSSIVWSSYVGGSGFDAAYSIKFDNNKNIVLAGGTTSPNFPTTAGAYQPVFNGIVDGWIARVAADGSAIINATFTGTVSFDQVYFVDLNASGGVFCYGQTAGHMPTTSGVYKNVNSGQFLQKFSADLSTLEISTVFGSGSANGLVIPNISPTAFLVNDCDNIYMAGWGGFVNSSPETGFWQSSTHGMPITTDAYQKTTSGSDFYFMVLNGDATQLVYSTYLGGSSSKTHVDGGTSRFDKYGIVYHAVCSGCSFGNTTGHSTSDFPTTVNAKSRINASPNCNNAAFKFDLSSLRAMFQTNNVALTTPGFNNVCYPDSIVFENLSTGGKTITWDFDDGTVITQKDTDPRSLIHQYQQPGQYRVKLKITDLSTCSQTDSTVKVINYFKANITAGQDVIICDGNSHQLMATGGVSYSWHSTDGKFTSSLQSPVVKPSYATAYVVDVVDANGCSKTDTTIVGVIPNVRAGFQTYNLDFSKPGYNNICYPDSLRFKNLSTHGKDFVWDFGDGTRVSQSSFDTVSVFHKYKEQGIYQVKLKAVNSGTCNKADSVVKTIYYFKDKIKVGGDGEICEGTEFQLTATGASLYLWYTEGNKFVSSNPSPVVRPMLTTQYFVTATDANGCTRKDTVKVTVLDSVDVTWKYRFQGNCIDRPAILVQNLTPPADDVTFRFDFGDGTTSEEREVLHAYKQDGLYSLKFVAQKKLCSFEETVQLPIYTLQVPNVFTPDATPGFNDRFEIRFGQDLIAPTDAGLNVQLMVFDRWGKIVFESQDYKNDWKANDLAAGVYYVQLRVGDFTTCKNWVHILK